MKQKRQMDRIKDARIDIEQKNSTGKVVRYKIEREGGRGSDEINAVEICWNRYRLSRGSIKKKDPAW